jgi:hypothetical protein
MFGEKRVRLLRADIIRVRARAVRRGVWFRALTRTERACVDLAIMVVERVRSRLLGNVLFSVLKKLEEGMESQVGCLMRDVGGNLAKKLSRIAQAWGNESAVRWAEDSGFKQYLTVTYMNAPT